jgi:glycosyltransferase involved in cell wall biosynthesis
MTSTPEKKLQISLIIPVKNEADSLDLLINSINKQSRAPDEIILVDGGSIDGTAALAEKLIAGDNRFHIIEAGEASPGKGRNIGTEKASNEWIAYTDAGIKLSDNWLEKLVEKHTENPETDIIYGNYAPIRETYFEKIASIVYVSPQNESGIRGKSIASSLMKKEVWTAIGGFPDLRASEDLIFMEQADKKGFHHVFAHAACVYWKLQPNLFRTFDKFLLYSRLNVLAGRQWDWHYGVLRQYLAVTPFVASAVFHSWWWLVVIVLWLFARTLKKMLAHRREFGTEMFFNPVIFFGVMFLILVIDFATFVGWGQAVLERKSYNNS